MERNESAQNWKRALDIQKIDGYKPNSDFLKLIEKEINGEITREQIIEEIKSKYMQN